MFLHQTQERFNVTFPAYPPSRAFRRTIDQTSERSAPEAYTRPQRLRGCGPARDVAERRFVSSAWSEAWISAVMGCPTRPSERSAASTT